MDGITAGERSTETETFAPYYAKYLTARQQYSTEVVPELAPLAAASDYLVTRRDGLTFVAIAIIDREARPERDFPLSVEQVQELAEACWPYTGKMYARKMPATVRIVEVGPGAINAAAIARLSPYRRRSAGSATIIQAWLLDTATGKTWINFWGARLGLAQAAERLMRAPRFAGDALAPPAAKLIAATLRPAYFTYALIALLLGIFGVEVSLSTGTLGPLLAPPISTLFTLGALSREAIVGSGQWWRLFTAPMLHADLAHVGFNCLALFLIGRRLEPLIGWRWTAASFATSAVCGSLLSVLINPATLVGVGASGGIVGLFAAALAVSRRLPMGTIKTRLIMQSTYGLAPALLPFLNGAISGSHNIDYGAHFGGAVAGVAVALIILRLWPDEAERPKLQPAALLVGAAYFLCAALSIVPISMLQTEYTEVDQHAPNGADLIAQADSLIRQYPHDPRIIAAQGTRLLEKHDSAGAEAKFRAALGERRIVNDLYGPAVQAAIEAELAATLEEEHRHDEAKAVAAPACPLLTPYMLGLMQKIALCPGTSDVQAIAKTAASPNAGVIGQSNAPPATPPIDANDASSQLDDALAKLRSGDVKAAQAELLAAHAKFADAEAIAGNPVVANNIEALLAVTMYVSGDDIEAQNLAAPICRVENTGVYAKLLKDDKLCP